MRKYRYLNIYLYSNYFRIKELVSLLKSVHLLQDRQENNANCAVIFFSSYLKLWGHFAQDRLENITKRTAIVFILFLKVLG